MQSFRFTRLLSNSDEMPALQYQKALGIRTQHDYASGHDSSSQTRHTSIVQTIFKHQKSTVSIINPKPNIMHLVSFSKESLVEVIFSVIFFKLNFKLWSEKNDSEQFNPSLRFQCCFYTKKTSFCLSDITVFIVKNHIIIICS